MELEMAIWSKKSIYYYVDYGQKDAKNVPERKRLSGVWR